MSATYEIGFSLNKQSIIPKNTKEKKISELSSKIDLLKQRSKDYDSLYNEYKFLLNEFIALKKSKERLENEIQKNEFGCGDKIISLKEENKKLQLSFNEKTFDAKKLFNENNLIERELPLKEEEIKNLKEKLNDISSQCYKIDENKNNLINIAQNLNKNILNQKEQIIKLKEDNICLTKICQENEQKIKQGQNEIKILYNQLDEINYDLNTLNQKESLKEKNLNNLNEKLNLSKENNIQLQKNINKLEKEFDEYRNDNDNIKNELLNERTLRINIENDNKKLKNILIQKETELNQLNNNNKKIKFFNDKNKNNNIIKNDKLKKQVILLESQNNNIIKEIDCILNEDKKTKKILTRKERISFLLKDNNNILEKSINDLSNFINNNENYKEEEISPRFS